MISSLEIRDSLASLYGSYSSYASYIFDLLKAQPISLGKKDAAKLAMESASELIKPLIEKIDPIYFVKSMRSSRISQNYAEKLLNARMMKGKKLPANSISRILANEYDYHGYAIMLEEAQTLDLNVEDVSKLDMWDVIKAIHNKNIDDGVRLTKFNVDVADASSDKSQTAKVKAATVKTEIKGDNQE